MISKEWKFCDHQREYRKVGTHGFADTVILIDADKGGHGCLFGFHFPSYVSIDGFCWNGDKKYCNFDDFMEVLSEIKKDYHMGE